jgi:hypothetical protein
MSTVPAPEGVGECELPSPGGHLGRRDFWLMLGLFLACLVTRIPLWPALITNPDGAECAFALERFDVAAGHPHPPGYLLFVWSAKVFYALGADANVSLLLASTLFSALSCALLYALGSLMFGRRVGMAAGVLLLFENNFWRMGLGHISSVTAAFWGIAVALGCWAAWERPGWRWTLGSAALLGVAAGFRQELLAFLGPLWLWSCRKAGVGKILAGLVVLALLTGLWVGLTSAAGGGYAAYRAASAAQWREVIYGGSVFAAAAQGPRTALESLIQHLGAWSDLTFGGKAHLSVLAWLLLGIYAVGRALRLDLLRRDQRPQMLVLWVLPAFVFHVLFHMFARAHATIYAPVATMVGGIGAVLLAGDWTKGWPPRTAQSRAPAWRLAVVLIVAAVVSAGAFLSGTLPGERQNVADLRDRLACIRQYPPGETILIQSDLHQDFVTIQYYAREYQSYLLQPTLGAGLGSQGLPNPLPLPDSARYVLFLNPAARVQGETRTVVCHGKPCFKVYTPTPGERGLHFGVEGVRFSRGRQDSRPSAENGPP